MSPAAKAPRRPAKASGDGRARKAERLRPDARDTAEGSTESTAALLARLRAERSLSQPAAARLLSASHGGSAESWQVTIARAESGAREPSPERLDALLELYGADADSRARQAVTAALPPDVVARLTREHGAERIGAALMAYGGMIRSVAGIVDGRRRGEST